MAKRSKSSHRWLARQRRDTYGRRAADEGLGSRAYFKLQQLDLRFRFTKARSAVLELGAAPGGWTRYLAERLPGAKIVACDRLAMTPPRGVTFIEGDVAQQAFETALDAACPSGGFDLVLSDMAPNSSGNRVHDQAMAMELFEIMRQTADKRLKHGGHMVVKMFQGEGMDASVTDLRGCFERIAVAKPEASRTSSREVYVVALTKVAGSSGVE